MPRGVTPETAAGATGYRDRATLVVAIERHSILVTR
jgi:hypothetical protein